MLLADINSFKAVVRIKGILMWLYEVSEKKHPHATALAREALLQFPWSYLVECGFSAATDRCKLKKIYKTSLIVVISGSNSQDWFLESNDFAANVKEKDATTLDKIH